MADQVPLDYQQFLDMWNRTSPPTPQQVQRADHTVNNAPRPLGMVEGGARQILQGIPGIGTWTDEIGGHLSGTDPSVIQRENEGFRQQHPIASTVGNVLGGVGTAVGAMMAPEAALGPVGTAIRGAATGARGIPAMLGTGAGIGALEGAGAANQPEMGPRLTGALQGGALGLGAAAVSPMIGGMVHNAVQGIGNMAARRTADKAIPGTAAVGDMTGPLPRPNFNRAPETMIGDLSPGATQAAGEIASRGDSAANKVLNAYGARSAKNTPTSGPPSKAQEGYHDTNQTIQDTKANYQPPPPRPGLASTILGAVPGAGMTLAGFGAAGADIGMPLAGKALGAAGAVGQVVNAIKKRGKKVPQPAGVRLNENTAVKAADVLGTRGKPVLDPAGKNIINPEIQNAVSVINDYLRRKEGVGQTADKAGRFATGVAGGAAAGAGATDFDPSNAVNTIIQAIQQRPDWAGGKKTNQNTRPK